MRLFLNLDTREFLQSPSFPRALTNLTLKRRDIDIIELLILRNGIFQELPAGSTIRLGLKPANSYSAEFLATGFFTKSPNSQVLYSLSLNLNTVPIAAAFAAETPEPASVAAMLEIEVTSGNNISSSVTLPTTLANDVVRGDEGAPAELPVFYFTENNSLQASKEEAETGINNNKWMSPLRTAQAIAALPPSPHQHVIADTSGLQTALDGKAASVHSHGSITNAGAIGNVSGAPIITGSGGVLQAGAFGTDAGTFCQGNDSRLSDARTPVTHTHAISQITNLQVGLDSKAALSHTHPLSALTQSSAATGQVATWNGTAWVPQTPAVSEGGGLSSQNPTVSGTLTIDNELRITGARIESDFNFFIDFEEGRFHYDGRDILNWASSSGTLLINSPLVVAGDEDLRFTGNEIWSGYGPTVFEFEEARLEYANNDVLRWGTLGQLSVASRTIKDLGAPVAANDAVRKVDLDSKAALSHTHPLSALTQSSAATGQVATWNGTAWVPQTPASGSGGVSSWNDLTDKPSTFPPSSHTHGNITNAGTIGSASGNPIITGAGGLLQTGAFGTTAGTFCQGNDSRLSDARTPTAHNHDASAITSGALANARTSATSANTANAIVARDASGNFSAGTITANLTGTASGNAPATGIAPSAITGTAVITTDSRLSDARTPTSHTHGNLTNAGAIGSASGVPIITGTSGVLQAGSFGTTAGTFAAGNHTHSNYVTTSGGITAIAVVSVMPGTPNPNTLYIVQ